MLLVSVDSILFLMIVMFVLLNMKMLVLVLFLMMLLSICMLCFVILILVDFCDVRCVVLVFLSWNLISVVLLFCILIVWLFGLVVVSVVLYFDNMICGCCMINEWLIIYCLGVNISCCLGCKLFSMCCSLFV